MCRTLIYEKTWAQTSKKRKTGAELRREQHLLPEILDGFPIGRHGRACAVLARSIRNLKKRERKPVNGITISPAENCLHGTCFIPPGWSGLWNLCTGCWMSILVRTFAALRIEMFRKTSISSENLPYPLSNHLEAVPIGAGTYLDGKCFVWLRQKRLKSVRIPARFFLARQKIFLANLHTVTYWYSFLKCELPPNAPFPTSCLTAFLSLTLLSLFGVKIDFRGD